MRMTRVPAGAELVLNKVSAAPGFWIGNVIVMAGIPSVMQAMLEYVTPQLKTGAKMLSESVRADSREGDIGTELGALAKQHPDVVMGSYPFVDENDNCQYPCCGPRARSAKACGCETGSGNHAGARESGSCGCKSVAAPLCAWRTKVDGEPPLRRNRGRDSFIPHYRDASRSQWVITP